MAPEQAPRIVTGHAEVVRAVRAAGLLMADLRAPVPARAPWLTAVLNTEAARRAGGRPAAVTIGAAGDGAPAAAAFLWLRRRGVTISAALLGQDVPPLPAGRPPARLLARDDDAALRLAGGILRLLEGLRRPWRLRLAGLPLGDPTTRALAQMTPTAAFGNARSHGLVDELDEVGDVARSRDPREVERWLPELLAREADPRARSFLRAAARLHAAIGQLEVAVVADGRRLRAGLLTLVEGTDRWPWWGASEAGGLRRQMNAPLVSLTGSGRPSVRFPGLSGRTAGR